MLIQWIFFSMFLFVTLCNFVYKVISKVMANPFRLLTPHLVSLNQIAFDCGFSIGESLILAHKFLPKVCSVQGAAKFCLKIDLINAFDKVKWYFILFLFHQMNFLVKWINWIHSCISTCMFSDLINNFPKGFFSTSYGLREGDSLFPYLFALVIEGL